MPKQVLNLLIICIISAFSCKTKSSTQNSESVRKFVVVHPISPTLDSLNNWCKTAYINLEISPKSTLRNYDSFSSQNSAFSGWACQTFEGNAQKYKFNQIKDGKSIREVSYYVNGVVKSDVYFDWSQGFGSERTWMADGKPYLESYYSSPGIMQGLQRKWFNNGVLSKEVFYNNSVIIYEVEYNRKGELIGSKGAVPSNNLK